MSQTAVLALRDYVQGIDAIEVFCAERYGKSPRHVIGYRKPSNANDYPFISYVPVAGEFGGMGGDTQVFSMVIGVCEPGVTDDVFDGVSSLGALQAALVPELLKGRIGDRTTLAGTIRVMDDFGVGHPFYQKEFQFKAIIKPA